jgi:quinol monooxygenase YgiN
MTQVNVVATIVAKKGKEKEVEAQLCGLLAPSRKDPGCLSYDLHQSIDDPAVFVFYETWKSQSLLEDHLKTPHLLAWLDKAPKLTTAFDVKLVTKIG